MTRVRFLRVSLVLLFVCALASLAQVCMAKETFKLRIGMYYAGGYEEPLDRTFNVRGNYPSSFQVIVINTDESAQPFYENATSGGYSSISFEITDENGNSNVVRKKRNVDDSSMVSSKYLKPLEKRVFDISIDEDTWENAYKLHKQGARKFRVRAIYDNNGSKIYSEYYDLEVIDSSGAPGAQSTDKDNASRGSSVLVSN